MAWPGAARQDNAIQGKVLGQKKRISSARRRAWHGGSWRRWAGRGEVRLGETRQGLFRNFARRANRDGDVYFAGVDNDGQ